MAEPYIAISRDPAGSYGWAMDQLAAGNDVRRADWPIEIRPLSEFQDFEGRGPFTWNDAEVFVWKVYRYGETGRCKGFSNGVVGADNDSWGDLGTDSGIYVPDADDLVALDWQTVDDVTDEQICRLNAMRMPRYPNAYLQEYDRSERAKQRRFLTVAISVIVILIAASVSAFHFR
jgi:hypothetical protein